MTPRRETQTSADALATLESAKLIRSPAHLAVLASRARWVPAPHLRLLNQKLLDLAMGKILRLAVTMPPRHGKSQLSSRYFPAWFIGLYAHLGWSVILASYGADFAASWGARARDVIREHGHRFGVTLDPKVNAANRWKIAGSDSEMMTAGVGGDITGRGCHLLIIDDPVKNAEEAHSETYRRKAWEWYTSTALTRVEPGGRVLLIQTRWHEGDLAGEILSKKPEDDGYEEWEVLNLPAIAEIDDPILGRLSGEPLWPGGGWTIDELAKRRQAVGDYVWSALFQQRPAPLEGNLFKRHWFPRYTTHEGGRVRLGEGGRSIARDALIVFATIDLAASEKESADWTVIATWGVTPGDELLLLDIDRFRLEGPDLVPAMLVAYATHGHAFVGIESAGFQLAIVKEAARAGLPVKELKADKSKIARALPAAAAAQRGDIWLPRDAAFVETFLSELMSFPNGKHDDQVDTLAYAVLEAERLTRAGNVPKMSPRPEGRPGRFPTLRRPGSGDGPATFERQGRRR